MANENLVVLLESREAKDSLEALFQALRTVQKLVTQIGEKLTHALTRLQNSLVKTEAGINAITNALTNVTTAISDFAELFAGLEIGGGWDTDTVDVYSMLESAIGIIAGVAGTLAAAGVPAPVIGIVSAILAGIALLIIAITTIVDDWENISGLFSGIGDMIGGIFSGDYQQVEDGFNNALKSYLSSDYMPYNIITALARLFGVDVEEEMAKAVEFLENGGSAFDFFVILFNEFLENLLEQVFYAISDFKKSLDGIWSGEDSIGEKVKSGINKIIEFFNKFLLLLPRNINLIIRELNNFKIDIPSWVPIYGGKSIGFSLDLLSVPQIPLLAKGAVLPANRPFLAMVGDQRHGTNVEAPLTTIQEAVALVMQDQTAAILSGFQASIGVQREILEAVLGIQIGDDIIGSAAARYQRKMAVAMGGF